MKFNCVREELVSCVSIAQKAIGIRNVDAILEGVHIESVGQGLKVKCTNLDLQIETMISATIAQEGACLIPGRLFYEVLKRLPGEEITVTLNEKNATLESGDAKTSIQIMDEEAFPNLPQIADGPSISIAQNAFKDLVRKTSYAAATDETKPILTGVLIELKNEYLNMVGLDGYRLAMNKVNIDFNKNDYNVVVPAKTIVDIAKILDDEDEPVEIIMSKNQIFLQNSKTRIIARLLEGEYLKYEQILPKEYKTRVKINANRLKQAIELASLMAREGGSNLVKLSIADNKIEITSNAETGNVYEKVQCYIEGSALDIAFNARYILDAIKNIDEEEIYMDFNTNVSPCLIRPVNGNAFLSLILPVRIVG